MDPARRRRNRLAGRRAQAALIAREDGFTLVELIVVMEIIALLSIIALPAFAAQRDKAHDTSMKSSARTAQVAIETYATYNPSGYSGATANTLRQIEPALNDLPGSRLIVAAPYRDNLYRVGARSETGNRFYIVRSADGTLTYTCTRRGSGACPGNGAWN